jgi:hypothetical protein
MPYSFWRFIIFVDKSKNMLCTAGLCFLAKLIALVNRNCLSRRIVSIRYAHSAQARFFTKWINEPKDRNVTQSWLYIIKAKPKVYSYQYAYYTNLSKIKAKLIRIFRSPATNNPIKISNHWKMNMWVRFI